MCPSLFTIRCVEQRFLPGPMVIGAWVSVASYGVACAQVRRFQLLRSCRLLISPTLETYRYLSDYWDDPSWIRCLVVSFWYCNCPPFSHYWLILESRYFRILATANITFSEHSLKYIQPRSGCRIIMNSLWRSVLLHCKIFVIIHRSSLLNMLACRSLALSISMEL